MCGSSESLVHTIAVCCAPKLAARTGANVDAMVYRIRLWQQLSCAHRQECANSGCYILVVCVPKLCSIIIVLIEVQSTLVHSI
jgi:hypothetical protein